MYFVSNCTYPKKDGLFMEGWIIEHDEKYPFWINKFLHQMNNSSSKQPNNTLTNFANF